MSNRRSHDGGNLLPIPGFAGKQGISQAFNAITRPARYVSTYKKAAARRLEHANKLAEKAQRLGGSKTLRGRIAQRMAANRMALAQRYQRMAGRFDKYTKNRFLAKTLKVSPKVQKALGKTPTDLVSKADRSALRGLAKDNVTRGLSKATGPLTLAFAGADIANQLHHGVPVAKAVGNTGSGVAASAAGSALLPAAAGLALEPGPGTVLALGIVGGVGASWAWNKVGAGKFVGNLAQGAVHDVGKGLHAVVHNPVTHAITHPLDTAKNVVDDLNPF